MHTTEQITFGAADLRPRPLGQTSRADDSSRLRQWASRQASEGAGSLQEEITHLSGAEIVVRMIRQRKYGPRQTNKPFITHNLVIDSYQGGWHALEDRKPLSEHTRELCGSLLILLLHPYLSMAPRSRLDLWV